MSDFLFKIYQWLGVSSWFDVGVEHNNLIDDLLLLKITLLSI
jgi:hypothetical protein